jgi:hypothetical protein
MNAPRKQRGCRRSGLEVTIEEGIRSCEVEWLKED